MKKVLWLDDIRNPMDYQWQSCLPNNIKSIKLLWVKNYDEYIKDIIDNGLPDHICFDHDLADEHYPGSSISPENYKEKTGLDCAKWTIEYCLDNNLQFPDFSVHSWNPVGKQNIIELINNFIKFRK